MNAPTLRRRSEHGIVLVSSLMLLVVITLIAISMFRSFGLQERIAGNMREKHRAVQAAETAQQYAEWWLTSGANANTTAVCVGGVLNANANQGQVCTNTLQSQVNVTAVPWTVGTGALGVNYTPPGMAVGAAGANTYYQPPRFYIAQLGAYAGGNGTVYQIDSVGYGGTAETVAVIESTYLVSSGVQDLGAQ
jgi:type IV pilus assembly protein PilX